MAAPVTREKRITQIKRTIKQVYIHTPRKSVELPREKWYSLHLQCSQFEL
jgi:hypothetical protein